MKKVDEGLVSDISLSQCSPRAYRRTSPCRGRTVRTSEARGDQHHSRYTQLNPHLVEVRNLGDVAEVDNREVLNLLSNRVESLVHDHALCVPIVPEADNDHAVLLGLDCFINVPARRKVWEEIRHD